MITRIPEDITHKYRELAAQFSYDGLLFTDMSHDELLAVAALGYSELRELHEMRQLLADLRDYMMRNDGEFQKAMLYNKAVEFVKEHFGL